ncbi:MAG: hypothetical protein KIT24_12900 [Phycisphaeraceae bacterium]|nr:hypothetical protein [Phycisphaeraceae bacterium]
MRLLADECVPRRAFEKLRELRNPGGLVVTEMVHLLERFEAGSPDDRWLQEIAAEDPPFLVITGDRARKSKRDDPRLPTLLPEAGINGIFLTGKLQQRPAFEKVRALMTVWPGLELAAKQRRGARSRLMPHGESYRLQDWPL